MKRLFGLFLLMLALFAPSATRAGDVDPGIPVAITPQYAQPEYTLRFRLPPSGWRAVPAVAPPWPEDGISVALHGDASGALGWVRFIPRDKGDLRAVLAWIRKRFGIDGANGLVFDASAERVTFSSYRNGYAEFHHIRRDLAMTHSYAWLQVSARPVVGAEAARKDFDFMVGSLRAATTPAQTAVGELASCLNRRGIKVYAAWWCGACNAQLAAFGPEVTRLNVVQCSDPSAHEIRDTCVDEGITALPSWVFPDGAVGLGVVDLPLLASAVGCAYAPPPPPPPNVAPPVKAPPKK